MGEKPGPFPDSVVKPVAERIAVERARLGVPYDGLSNWYAAVSELQAKASIGTAFHVKTDPIINARLVALRK